MTVGGKVALSAMRIERPGQTGDAGKVAQAASVEIEASALEPLSGRYRFSRIALRAPVLEMQRLRDRRIVGGRGETPAALGVQAPATPGAASAATAAPLPDLEIAQFSATDGALRFDDAALTAPVTIAVGHIDASLQNLSLRREHAATVRMHARLALGGVLGLAGNVTVSARRAALQVTVDDLALTPWQAYMQPALAGRIVGGRLRARLPFAVDWRGASAAVQLTGGEAGIDALALAARATAPGAVQAATLEVGHLGVLAQSIDTASRSLVIGAVDVNGAAVQATRLKDGALDLAALLAKPPGAAPGAAVSGTQEAPWRYQVARIRLSDSRMTLTDLTPARPVTVSLRSLGATVDDLSADPARPIAVSASMNVNGGGTFSAHGRVIRAPGDADLTLAVSGLDLAALEPYFGERLNARLASGALDAAGRQRVFRPTGAPSLTYDGDASLTGVRLLDRTSPDVFAGWRTLAATRIAAGYDGASTRLSVAQIGLDTFYARVILDPQGRLNLARIVHRQQDAPVSLATLPGASAASASAPAQAAPVAPRHARAATARRRDSPGQGAGDLQ
jgi:hypothetical protein